MKMNKIALAAAAAVSAVATSAHATGPDLTSLTSSFSAADVVTPVLAIAGTLATVYVAMKAAKIVLGMLRGS